MWPFSSRNVLDQQVAQAMPQSGFGALSGPPVPQQDQQPQKQPNRILNNPQLLNALGRMGNAISLANSQGAGFGASFAAGSNAFLDERARQEEATRDQQIADAQVGSLEARRAADEQEAQYGVRSQGFEGDIARARAILNDPMARDQDKAIAQAVLETAQRLQPTVDPVNGDVRYNPRAQFAANSAPPAPPTPQPNQAIPAMPSAQPMSDSSLLPPPSGVGQPDTSMFSVPQTGNRKVDAALQEEAGKAQIAGRRGINEGMAKVDTETFGQIANQTRQLSSMLPQLQRIETLAANTKTGGIGVARNEFGKLFGMDLEGVPETQAITAIQNAIGPSLRTPGSGASSDKDVAIFMSSIPTLMNTPQGIREINRTYEKLLDRKKKEEGIARKLLREDGNLERFYQETEKLGPVFEGSKVAAPDSTTTAPQFDRSAIEAEMRRRMLK